MVPLGGTNVTLEDEDAFVPSCTWNSNVSHYYHSKREKKGKKNETDKKEERKRKKASGSKTFPYFSTSFLGLW